MYKQILSTQNTYIKELVQLKEKSRIRKKKQLFLIEGLREISLAIKGEYKLKTVLFDKSIINENGIENLLELQLIILSLLRFPILYIKN